MLQSMRLQSVGHDLVIEQQEQPELMSTWNLRTGPYCKSGLCRSKLVTDLEMRSS